MSIPTDYLNTIVCMDALDFLRLLPDGAVPLFLFSPPYNLGNSTGGAAAYACRRRGHYPADAPHGKRGGNGKWYGGPLGGYGDAGDDSMPWPEYIAWQQAVLTECWRCLPENGAIYYNHKPRILDNTLFDPICCIPDDIPIRQRVIWQRAGGVNFNPTYYLPTHEYVYVIAKPDFRLRDRVASGACDIWSIMQETSTWHPCPFPLALAERVLETAAPSLVCDPFSGSGTVARAARRFGIPFIGCDRNEEYVRRANQEVARKRRLTLRQSSIADVLVEQAELL
jgi:site-specific DNA-methyltransferase (adenine-specific)